MIENRRFWMIVYNHKEKADLRKIGMIVWLGAVAGMAAGCGPTLSTQVRLETVKAPDNPGSVPKDGLVVEIPESKNWVQQFVVSAATCGADGTPAKDPISGGPIMKDIAISAPGTSIYQVKMTNQTDHIIRLQGSVIRGTGMGGAAVAALQGRIVVLVLSGRSWTGLGPPGSTEGAGPCLSAA